MTLAGTLALAKIQASTVFVGAGDSIQNAIDLAQDGDVIEVASGVYNERIDFGGRQVILRSVSGPENTVINGESSGTTVQIGGNAEISGFTITGGRASFGAGMSVSGIGTRIVGNIFSGNAQGDGGFGAAIGGNGASPFISRNIFTNNSSDSQFLSGAVSFVNSSSPVIENNVFFNNQGRGLNLTLPTGNSPIVTNNTFWGNSSAIRIDGRVNTSAITLQNNILGNNAIALEVDFFSSGSFADWSNNLLFDNNVNYDGIDDMTGANGNLDADPLFRNAGEGDFQLLVGSPAIDAGTSLAAPSIDFDGLNRPFDGDGNGFTHIDIGAFEFIPEPSSVSLILTSSFWLLMHRRRSNKTALTNR